MCDDLLQEYVREVIINTISENNMPTNKDGIYWKQLENYMLVLVAKNVCDIVTNMDVSLTTSVVSPTSLKPFKYIFFTKLKK